MHGVESKINEWTGPLDFVYYITYLEIMYSYDKKRTIYYVHLAGCLKICIKTLIKALSTIICSKDRKQIKKLHLNTRPSETNR